MFCRRRHRFAVLAKSAVTAATQYSAQQSRTNQSKRKISETNLRHSFLGRSHRHRPFSRRRQQFSDNRAYRLVNSLCDFLLVYVRIIADSADFIFYYWRKLVDARTQRLGSERERIEQSATQAQSSRNGRPASQTRGKSRAGDHRAQRRRVAQVKAPILFTFFFFYDDIL